MAKAPWLLSFAAAILVGGTSLTANAAALDDCVQQMDWSLRVTGCTEIIESGRWAGIGPATAYRNRGIALRALGELSRALTDLERAESLDPTYARLYDRLGALAALNTQLFGQPRIPMCDCERPPPPSF